MIICTAAVALLAAAGCSRPGSGPVGPRAYRFGEVWGYLMKGEERRVTGREPFTDILYFGVTVDRNCRIAGASEPPSLPYVGRPPRLHLVVFLLNDPARFRLCAGNDEAARELLAADIASRAAAYSGLQIDFEALEEGDGTALVALMASLRKRLPDAVLSAAVPAKADPAARPAYDYAALAAVCDRVFIMAYDQHWKSSGPGPVAALSWCDRVAHNAVASIPRERLVMGIPLYGRAWQDARINRALTWAQATGLSGRAGGATQCEERGAFFEYTEKVKVRVFFEDAHSIHAKLRLYDSYGIPGVAFWRIGQGPPDLWDSIVTNGR